MFPATLRLATRANYQLHDRVKNMRITTALLITMASLCSFPSIAQDWAPGFYEDRELFESGGGSAEGGVCMHVTSRVGREPPLWEVEPNYNDLIDNEVRVEILSDSREQRIVQAANIALERHGFVRVGDNVYELPGSSLCFLKIYRAESPKRMTFIPFFKSPLERCDAVFTTRYDPVTFEQTLLEEFARFGVAEYEIDHQHYMMGTRIRIVDKCE